MDSFSLVYTARFYLMHHRTAIYQFAHGRQIHWLLLGADHARHEGTMPHNTMPSLFNPGRSLSIRFRACWQRVVSRPQTMNSIGAARARLNGPRGIKVHCENQLIYAKLLPLAVCISGVASLLFDRRRSVLLINWKLANIPRVNYTRVGK